MDGGGIRGILTLEVLVRMEEMLAEATDGGDGFRLCHFFDYVGGTSTGAIIAAGLARGMSARELLDFYQQTGPAMFFIQIRASKKGAAEGIWSEFDFGTGIAELPVAYRNPSPQRKILA